MTRKEYFNYCLTLAKHDPEWCRRVLAGGEPLSRCMKPRHFALMALAMRKAGMIV